LGGQISQAIKKPFQAHITPILVPEVWTRDPQIGDTILHKAGYIIREAVEDEMESEKREKGRLSVS